MHVPAAAHEASKLLMSCMVAFPYAQRSCSPIILQCVDVKYRDVEQVLHARDTAMFSVLTESLSGVGQAG